MKRSFYDVLGVSETASSEEIETQFQVLQKRYQENWDEESANTLMFVREARSVLLNAPKRAVYDATLTRQSETHESPIRDQSGHIGSVGLLVHALKRTGTKWLGAASDISRADAVINGLTGVNPKHLPPEVYRAVCSEVNNYWQREYEATGRRLTLDEVILLKLAFLSQAAKVLQNARLLDLFGEACRAFSVRPGTTIDPGVHLHAVANRA